MPADAPARGGLSAALSHHWIILLPILVAVSLAAWLPGFATIGPVDRDEPRYAQATKQMLETGDFIDIRLQEDPRYKKPIGIYWLQATSATLVDDGALSALWVYRLPSLLGALAAVMLTAAMAAAMFDRKVALLAGVGLATCVLLGVEARLAKTDAVLLALIVLGHWALWQLWSKRDAPSATAGLWWVVFWVAQGLAILVKGPIGPLVTLLTIAGLVIWERRIGWLERLCPRRGLLVTGLIALPWLVAIGIVSNGTFFVHALGIDALGKVAQAQESHGAPPGFYLAAMWGTAWPFVALVPLALLWLWRERRTDQAKFLVAWVLGFWLFMELLATKLPHYVLPTYPALAIAAAAAVYGLRPGRGWVVGVPLVIVLMLGTGLAVGAIVLPFLLRDTLPAPTAAAALIAVLLLWWSWRAYVAGRFERSGLAGVTAALVLYFGIYEGLFPRMEALDLSRHMAEQARVHGVCANPEIASVGYHEPSAVFFLGTQLRLLEPSAAAALLADAPCALAFVDDRHLDAFETAAAGQVRTLTTIEGWRLNGGRWTTITLFGSEP